MNYVMSDIHGLYYKFLDMLKKIKFNDNDNLYILGDVIDRGEFGIDLLKYIQNKKNIFLIRGNHEQMMIDSYHAKDKFKEDLDEELKTELISTIYDWINNGGQKTLFKFNTLDSVEQKSIINYLTNLKNYEILTINNKNYLLIHAGIYIPNNEIINDITLSQSEINNIYNIEKKYISLKKLLEINIEKDYYLYIREYFLDAIEHLKDFIIIFGHTPTYYIPRYTGYVTKPMNDTMRKRCSESKIYKTKYKIGIDCNAGKEPKLSCLRLEDFKEYYIKI